VPVGLGSSAEIQGNPTGEQVRLRRLARTELF
jgi:hypothetical protein